MRALAVGVLLALLAACGSSSVPSTASADGFSQLRRDGRWLKDASGRTVLIHGVNAVWKLAPFTPPDASAGFTAADADWLVAHGFNGVRLGVLFAGVMPEPGAIDTGYLDQVDRVVQLLASRGIYVLFDFHQDMYTERYQGEGFPDWATEPSSLDGVAVLGFPLNYFTPPVTQAFERFWSNDLDLWRYYGEAWQAVAARWAGQDRSMGYDLMNEPWPGKGWALCAVPLLGCPTEEARMQRAYDAFRVDIRETDPDNIVWFEPQQLFNTGIPSTLGLTAVDDPQLGFSWHNYCVIDGLLASTPVTITPLCGTVDSLVFANAAVTRERLAATDLLTEFGATDNTSILARITRLADASLTGWMYWQYKNWADPTTQSGDSGAQGLFDDDADLTTAKTAKLGVLERAYPQATAGTPTSLRYDQNSGDFEFHYTAMAVTGKDSPMTDIYLPLSRYPAGYTVNLDGAEQISEPGAAILRIKNQPGAAEVVVKVVATAAAT